MALVATEHLRWGDETIPPGAPVPEGEPGRDYGMLLRAGSVERVAESSAPAKRRSERPAKRRSEIPDPKDGDEGTSE